MTRLPQPFGVAREHLLVGEQVVGEQHGLRALQVRVAGHHRLRLAIREVDQRASQRPQARGGLVAGGAHEHPQIGRHLVVARARGVQPPRRFADAFGEGGLDVEVDVLAILAELEAPGLDLRLDRAQALDDRVAVGVLDDALLREHPRVGDRAGDVLAVEPPVEADRCAVGLDERVGRRAEASAPELAGPLLSVLVRHRSRLAPRARDARAGVATRSRACEFARPGG